MSFDLRDLFICVMGFGFMAFGCLFFPWFGGCFGELVFKVVVSLFYVLVGGVLIVFATTNERRNEGV